MPAPPWGNPLRRPSADTAPMRPTAWPIIIIVIVCNPDFGAGPRAVGQMDTWPPESDSAPNIVGSFGRPLLRTSGRPPPQTRRHGRAPGRTQGQLDAGVCLRGSVCQRPESCGGAQAPKRRHRSALCAQVSDRAAFVVVPIPPVANTTSGDLQRNSATAHGVTAQLLEHYRRGDVEQLPCVVRPSSAEVGRMRPLLEYEFARVWLKPGQPKAAAVGRLRTVDIGAFAPRE